MSWNAVVRGSGGAERKTGTGEGSRHFLTLSKFGAVEFLSGSLKVRM